MNYRMIFSIIGKILIAVGLLMLLPLIVSVIYRENVLPFVYTIIMFLSVGLCLMFLKPKVNKFYAKEGIVVVGLSWIFISFLGSFPFYFSGEITSFIDCFFETASGFTTTGASILNDIESMSRGLLFWRSFTHWLGGMGVLVFILAVLPETNIVTNHLLKSESPGPQGEKLVSKVKFTARILYGIYCLMTLLEGILLLFGGMDLFHTFIIVFGTAGTGGFTATNNSIAYFDSLYIEVVVTVFMFLFGINFNIYFLILIGKFSRALRSEEFRIYVSIIVVSVILITINIYHLYANAMEALRYSSFQVVAIISTTGFGLANYIEWPMFSQSILLLLMFIGASGGSTGGGFKVVRVLLILKGAFSGFKSVTSSRSISMVKLDKKRLDEDIVNGVFYYFAIYIVIIFISTVIISLDNQDFATSFSSVVSCVNNIGPGLGEIGPTGNYNVFSPLSKLVLSFNMLLGRLELYPILILFMPKTWMR